MAKEAFTKKTTIFLQTDKQEIGEKIDYMSFYRV